MSQSFAQAAHARLKHLFAEREITLRSHRHHHHHAPARAGAGHHAHERVRTIRLSTRKQVGLAALATGLATAWAVSLGLLALDRQQTAADRARVTAQEAEVRGDAATVAQWRGDVDKVTQDLAQRQQLLEALVGMLPADAVAAQEAAEAAAIEETGGRTQRIGAALPQGAALMGLERRQLALAARVTHYAEGRADQAEAAIRKLGVSPAAVRDRNRQAMGGPLEAFASSADGSLSPRFERLGASLARMDELERSMSRVPQVMPVAGARLSSNFGYRHDPFHGTAAFHGGQDFAAPMGTPILAAADGRVSFVGIKGGYGKCVEVTHGNGLITRYGHLSGFVARVGQQVAAGDQIAKLGSTGRSTGPHLHFEVRVNGRAVNPMPFLRNAPALLAGVRDAG